MLVLAAFAASRSEAVTGNAQVSRQGLASSLAQAAAPLETEDTPTNNHSTLLSSQRRLAQLALPVLAGTWSVIDASLQAQFGVFVLPADGSFRSPPMPPNFGGPNGLGANRWNFSDGLLSFVYEAVGRRRSEMLVGAVHSLSNTEFTFTVVGGFYGQGRNAGAVFIFRKS